MPLSLGMTSNTRDSDGRPTAMTLAGSRALAMGYDLAGNVTSVTPPAKPAHDFGFDPNNLLASYLPPDGTPSVNPRNTTYTRDKDNLLTLASNILCAFREIQRRASTNLAVLDLLAAGADPLAKNRTGATFQLYVNMTPVHVTAPETQREREKIRRWLVGHHIPIES